MPCPEQVVGVRAILPVRTKSIHSVGPAHTGYRGLSRLLHAITGENVVQGMERGPPGKATEITNVKQGEARPFLFRGARCAVASLSGDCALCSGFGDHLYNGRYLGLRNRDVIADCKVELGALLEAQGQQEHDVPPSVPNQVPRKRASSPQRNVVRVQLPDLLLLSLHVFGEVLELQQTPQPQQMIGLAPTEPPVDPVSNLSVPQAIDSNTKLMEK
mmetsp:Transcript_48558/g.103920  ORF Transcript_48558/g.103920 Transcript_48558/m.103920 type:complete len:216 (-) Transcript_48558:363-1010(-)